MTIYQFLQRGEYHVDFCEDFTVVMPLGEDKLVCAVLDGCTLGQDSHFAATLGAKLLRKAAKEYYYQELYQPRTASLSLPEELKLLVAGVFHGFREMRNLLLLDTPELLTTLVILLLDTARREAMLLALGDATVAVNGELIRFEQQNRPDYLAYHLGEDFDAWYALQRQRLHVLACRDISLATDGIDSFRPVAGPALAEPAAVAHRLLVDEELAERAEMLNIKVRQLQNAAGLVPTDDVAIIRVRLP
ncbi:hypothetical protein HNQ93_002666 [Hymenobacter luteus]|uniref:PPM-type phosphatase domain-containing protein n=2 Tax=Hymenobacter TaxID=89966 RepID=A0A7W9T1D3_9BACT|nr:MULTISPECIES: protein phosphatase 2C domain-containing protein [Hymenobacter]MBB4601765.1 hypothetical protein [Hymenobacter latericoloratus]MBB6059806.1 hypothetical protein [Hymenobacter luteus]